MQNKNFQAVFASTLFRFLSSKRATLLAHIGLVVMFGACLGFPVLYGYDNFGLGLNLLPSMMIAPFIGAAIHLLVLVGLISCRCMMLGAKIVTE